MEWTYLPSIDPTTNYGSLIGQCHDILPTDLYLLLENWCYTNPHYMGHQPEEMPVPRTQIWYQQDHNYFCPSWKGVFPRWKSRTYDTILQLVQNYIQTRIDSFLANYSSDQSPHQKVILEHPKINSCLVNRYRNGNDSIKPHRDSRDSFGPTPTIIGLSLGQCRTLELQPALKNHQQHPSYRFKIPDNSLFIMAGNSQNQYLHSIPKQKSTSSLLPNFERFSLTFREWKHPDQIQPNN